jgi:hypothetical protein
MKKIVSFSLTLAISFSLVLSGCGKIKDPENGASVAF